MINESAIPLFPYVKHLELLPNLYDIPEVKSTKHSHQTCKKEKMDVTWMACRYQ